MPVAALAALGCGEDASDGNGAASGSAPPPGAAAEGWTSAFSEGGVRLSCDSTAEELLAVSPPAITVESTTIVAGYEQVGDNQNPILARIDGDAVLWCVRHEAEGPDGRALGLSWDGGDHVLVTYSIVGGGTALEGKGGWIASYAPGALSGGGPKVSVVGRVAASDGVLDRATFVLAVRTGGQVNTHGARAAATMLDDGTVEFLGSSAHKPIDADGASAMSCTDYPFDSRYVLSADLSELICASASNCSASRECP